MINKKNLKIIEKDLWEKFEYELKSWWDFDVFIVNKKWIYRFLNEEKSLDLLEKEKKVLNVIK
jgi:hypothetical protein